MPRIPGSDYKAFGREDSSSYSEGASVSADQKDTGLHSNAEMWWANWYPNERRQDRTSTEALHERFLKSLREVCREYLDRGLDSFPRNVVWFLEIEIEKLLDGFPSRVLKSPSEGYRTTEFGIENAFEATREVWEENNYDPAYVLKALADARAKGVSPPEWVVQKLLEAGANVYDSYGDKTFDEALGLTKGKIKKAHQHQIQCDIAELVAEGVDSDLAHEEARELAVYEAVFVYGYRRYELETVQKYYERYGKEKRCGFGPTFMHSLRWLRCIDDENEDADADADDIYKSCRLVFWRRKTLGERLRAYNEAERDGLNPTETLKLVSSRTAEALRRKPPPKTKFGDYSELDY
jgi:hypothetical protein